MGFGSEDVHEVGTGHLRVGMVIGVCDCHCDININYPVEDENQFYGFGRRRIGDR